jgi:hypothetical protein
MGEASFCMAIDVLHKPVTYCCVTVGGGGHMIGASSWLVRGPPLCVPES